MAHASPDTAKVIKDQAVRYLAVQEPVGENVSSLRASLDIENSIAGIVQATHPNPARTKIGAML
jgi:hypothetical protein